MSPQAWAPPTTRCVHACVRACKHGRVGVRSCARMCTHVGVYASGRRRAVGVYAVHAWVRACAWTHSQVYIYPCLNITHPPTHTNEVRRRARAPQTNTLKTYTADVHSTHKTHSARRLSAYVYIRTSSQNPTALPCPPHPTARHLLYPAPPRPTRSFSPICTMHSAGGGPPLMSATSYLGYGQTKPSQSSTLPERSVYCSTTQLLRTKLGRLSYTKLAHAKLIRTPQAV